MANIQEVEQVICNSGRTGAPDLRLLHYNDVYHIEAGSAEPVGGVARFQTAVNQYRDPIRYADQPALITLFSGDAFNPSLESTVTKGKHMVPFLNRIGTNVACIGNHDLDFGVDQFSYLRDQCKFPWLLANVLDPALGDDVPLASCIKSTILKASNGIKIGVIGIAEREWLATINALPPNLIYKSASVAAQELVPKLKEQGCDILIALTHAREPNDIKLAHKTLGIDLILSGHDHNYNHVLINDKHVLRSGADFKQLSYIQAWRKGDGEGWDFTISRRDICRSIPEDPESVKMVDSLTLALREKLNKPVGYTAAPLDARFTTVRMQESNLGNFVCDILRHYYDADCALMAAGTIRGDQIYPPGVLRIKDLMNCFPFEDPVVVLRITGQDLLDALENAVSLYPALEGRFPQVSNIHFEFDPKQQAQRIKWVKVDGRPLDTSRKYVIATRGYMAHGKEGFDTLLAESEGGMAEEVVSEENGMLISAILRQYFLSLKILGRWRRFASLHKHWEVVHGKLHELHTVKDSASSATVAELEKTGACNARLRDTAQVAFESADKISDTVSAQDAFTRYDMVDSDSDGSITLPEERLTKTTHPLAASCPDDYHMSHDHSDRLYHLARSYGRLWMELAGIDRGCVGMVEEHGAEQIPSWTRGIAPQIEGRIKKTA